MSRRRVYSDDTKAILDRYFDTLMSLSENKQLKGGMSGFCNDNGIDRRHLMLQNQDRGRGYFEVSWLLPLIKDYRVSTAWLLMGVGPQYI